MNILLKIMEFLIFHVTQEFNIAKNVKIDIVAKCAKQLIILLEMIGLIVLMIEIEWNIILLMKKGDMYA